MCHIYSRRCGMFAFPTFFFLLVFLPCTLCGQQFHTTGNGTTDDTYAVKQAITARVETFAAEHGGSLFKFGKARPVKIRYKHSEKGGIEFVLVNKCAQKQTVIARAIVSADDDIRGVIRTIGEETTLALAAGKSLTDTLSFAIPKDDGGYTALIEIVQNDSVVARAGDVFCVSDNPFLFAIQPNRDEFPYMLSGAGKIADLRKRLFDHPNTYIADCKKALERLRSQYGTYQEFFVWAREDATLLTETSDEPYLAGQASWPVSRKQIRLINNLLQSQGMATVAYVNSIPFGWPGFEVMRKHPEWFSGAGLKTESLEKYLKNFQSDSVDYGNYPAIPCNYDAVSANGGKSYIDYHIEQLLASVAMYNWEAFRYDAGPLPMQYFIKVKAVLKSQNPPIGIGNNMGVFGLGETQNDKWKTYSADQSYMMEEAIIGAFQSVNSAQRKWDDFIDLMRLGAYLTRSNGGHYTYINHWGGNWISTALGYMMGGHPAGVKECPIADYNRFMVRYGYTFWDLRTQMLPVSQTQIVVTSSRPLWWKKFVSERIFSKEHRQIIVPLFNLPDSQEVVNTTISTIVNDARVQFRPLAGEKVTAWLLMPEPVAKREKTQAASLADGSLFVDVPTFKGWSNVVFDCQKSE